MDSENTSDLVEALFVEALRLPEGEWAAFLAERCGHDNATRKEVLQLLAARRRMGAFLEGPRLDFAGQRFGAYRALAEIGRGGMSVVYRGERIEGDFVKRVAIKIVLARSPGAPTTRETQILASLEHPNIARLLDAGTTPQGFRYLVMEFIEGIPVTRFAEAGTEEKKLGLFLQVCRGVEEAHKALVVHRDLKPDNILVTADGTAKLLDFGIAKMLEPDMSQTVGSRAYTVDYASPEQILGLPASTSNDIYSLGVLLCELVGGRVPRMLSKLTIADLMREIQNKEVSDLPLAGDLAVIAHKALRRDPAERYAGVNALARDVERFLARQPIEACEQIWSYRAGKFMRRHRYAVGAAALAFAALGVTAGIAVREAHLAEKQFNEVRGLARAMMYDLHDAVRPLAGSLPARKVIVDKSLRYLDALAADNASSDELLLEVARGYHRLAEIEGTDYVQPSTGESAQANLLVKAGLALARKVAARSPRNPEAKQVLRESLTLMTASLQNIGKPEEGVPLAREAVQLADYRLKSSPADPAAKLDYASAQFHLADVIYETREQDAAFPAWQASLKIYEELRAAHPDGQTERYNVARVHNFLASAYFRKGEYEKASEHNEQALAITRKLSEEDPKGYRGEYASNLGTMAALAGRRKNHEREVELYFEQLRIRQQIAAGNPRDMTTATRVAATLDRIGNSYRIQKKFPEAIRYGADSLAAMRKVTASDPANANAATEMMYSLLDLAQTYQASGDMTHKCTLALEAVRLLDGPMNKMELDMTGHIQRAKKYAQDCSRR